MTTPTFPDLSTLRSFVDEGKIRASKSTRRRLFAPGVVGMLFKGSNLLGDQCYDLLEGGQIDGRSRRRDARPWRVYVAPFARVTAAGYHWRMTIERAPNDCATGCGLIDGHDEDDDLRVLVAGIDTRTESEPDPDDRFWAALQRREPLLRRAAAQIGQALSEPGELLPPRTIRVCSSWLLSN